MDNTGLSRRGLLALGIGSLVSVGVAPHAFAQMGGDPATPIQALDAALLRAMQAGRSLSFGQRMAVLQPVLAQSFDLPAVLQASVGLGWASMSPGDRGTLLAAFERYTAANYAANFDSYNNQSFRILADSRSLPDGRVIVQTRLSRPGGEEHKIDYVMRSTPQGWKAVDVLADGTISRVAVQRSDFSSALARGGPTGLAARLSSVVASLASSSSVA